MGRLVRNTILIILVAGCAPGPPPPPLWTSGPAWGENPAFVAVGDHHFVWETVVDVVDDYFRIKREDPVRVVGTVLTEGWLDTFPIDPPTMLEPWRPDSGSPYDKLENTLQSTRRRAVVRVMPDHGGHWVDVVVYKELEDLERPVHASAGAATFRNDSSLTRVVNPENLNDVGSGWIDLGRDVALEQEILAQVLDRTGSGIIR